MFRSAASNWKRPSLLIADSLYVFGWICIGLFGIAALINIGVYLTRFEQSTSFGYRPRHLRLVLTYLSLSGGLMFASGLMRSALLGSFKLGFFGEKRTDSIETLMPEVKLEMIGRQSKRRRKKKKSTRRRAASGT